MIRSRECSTPSSRKVKIRYPMKYREPGRCNSRNITGSTFSQSIPLWTQKKNRNKFDLCSVNDTAESEYSYDIHATLKLHSSDARLRSSHDKLHMSSTCVARKTNIYKKKWKTVRICAIRKRKRWESVTGIEPLHSVHAWVDRLPNHGLEAQRARQRGGEMTIQLPFNPSLNML